MEKKIDIWKAAAVVLEVEGNKSDSSYDGALDVHQIRYYVESSGLTTLGEKGETPLQTIRGKLANKKYFDFVGEGHYSLNVPIEEVPDYENLIKRYKEAVERQNELLVLKYQVQELREENSALKDELQSIKKLLN